MNFLVLFPLAAILLIYVWLKRRCNYWTSRGFPSAELIFPFGSLKGIGTDKSLCTGLDEFYKQFKEKGPAVGLFYFVKPMLLPMDPALIKSILVTNFDCFQDRSIYYNKEDDPISAHLLALEGKAWRERRVKLTPTFTSGKMKIMFEIIDAIGDKLVTAVENAANSECQIEVHELLACFTTDNISNVAFGLNSNSLENPDSAFRKYGKQVVDLNALDFLKFFFTSAFPKLSRKMRLTCNKRSVINFFYNTFKESMEHRERSNLVRKDFLQILLELKKLSSLTVDELAAESFIFFLGGFETSSSLSVFAMYELALNPEIQEKLRSEIRCGLEDNSGKLTYDMLFGFKYLDMVVNETLRKYPPAFIITRNSTKEFKIPGTEMTIPAHTDINISVLSIHRDPDYYPNPDKFDPERFNPENVRNRKPFTFIPFGDGPRKCIGGRFGLLQAKLGIVKLVSNFEFSPSAQTTIPMKFSPPALFLSPINKMWLTVKKLER